MAWLLPGRSGLFAAMDLEAFIKVGGLGGWPLAWIFPLILVAWFLTSVTLAWLVLRTGAWLDRRGRVIEALAWPLRSRTFMLASLSWVSVTAAALLVARPDLDGSAGWLLLTIGVLAGLLVPFVAWRPGLLGRPHPSPLWGLYWPGWRAVLLGGLCVLCGMLFGLAEMWLDPLLPGWVLIVLDEVLTAVGLVLMLLTWFNGGRFAPMAADLRRLPRGEVVRELLAFAWLVGWMAVFLGMPVLVASVHAIYVVPELARAGAPLTWSSNAVAWLIHEGQGISLIAVFPLNWYLALAEGRWARGHGIGCLTIAESRD